MTSTTSKYLEGSKDRSSVRLFFILKPDSVKFGANGSIRIPQFVLQTRAYRLLSSTKQMALTFVVPALIFRLSFLIFTHNSVTLSLFVAFMFIYLPARAVLFEYYLVQPRPAEIDYFTDKRLLGLVGEASNITRRLTVRNLCVLMAGVLYTISIYTYGLQSPYSTGEIERQFVTERALKPHNDAFFIAANFYNNERVLPYWISEVTKLIGVLGKDNVYVSLSENDSSDGTASKLLQFARYLHHQNIPYSLNITAGLRPLPRHDPWKDAQDRIRYMTTIRNTVLAPLDEVSATPLGARIKSIIFLNDVIHKHVDVLKLVDLVDRSNSPAYSPVVMACGLDIQGSTLYDQWAVRDKCGKPVNGLYPYFQDKGDRALVRREGVVEVGTCWNGVVVMNADAFMTPPRISAPYGDAQVKLLEPLRFPEPPTCEISECTLLPLALLNSYISDSRGEIVPRIVMDTSVIVAYEYKWWWYYAYFLRVPAVKWWVAMVERPLLSLWEKAGLDRAYIWKELPDGCLIDKWVRCQPKGTDSEPQHIGFLPDSISARSTARSKARAARVLELEARKKSDLRKEERTMIGH